jgi:hypothetical protein
MNALTEGFPCSTPCFGLLPRLAENSIETVIQAGATILAVEPWRIARIIRSADGMTFQELATEVSRRRALPPSADFNRILALAQLACALERPGFAASWAKHARNYCA